MGKSCHHAPVVRTHRLTQCKTHPSTRADGAFGQLTGPWCPSRRGGEASPPFGMRDFTSIHSRYVITLVKDEECCYATRYRRVKRTFLSFVIKDDQCFKVLHCLMSLC